MKERKNVKIAAIEAIYHHQLPTSRAVSYIARHAGVKKEEALEIFNKTVKASKHV